MLKEKSPLYVKVMNYLIKKINEEYQPGDLLPTQTELAEKTGTSLITVKRAITELANDGYLKPIPGKGTFVKKPPLKDEHTGVSSWTDSVAGLGEIPDTAWINIEKRRPPDHIANLLKISSQDQTVLIDRLRTIDGKPVCLMANEFPLELVPDMHKESIEQESIYAWIQDKYQLIPATAEEEVYARHSSDEEKEQLKMEEPIVLVIKRISYLKDGTPVEFSQIVAPAESYRYRSKHVNRTLENREAEESLKYTQL